MNVCKALFALLLTCTLASAAACKRDLQPTGEALYDPYSAIAFPPITILIRSGGHTIEIYFYNNGFDVTGADVFVDGQHTGTLDTRDAQRQISALCGPDFQFPPLLLKPARSASMGQIASPSGHVSRDIAVADFNGDGISDNATLSGSVLVINLYNAAGRILSTQRITVAGMSIAQNVVTADFNGDGKPDLAVTQGTFPTSSNRFPPGNVVILLGKGDGTFGTPTLFPAGTVSSSYLTTGDFNGDGITDLAMTHPLPAGGGAVAVLLGNGQGSFGAATDYPVGPAPYTLVAADFTGDGIADIAALDAFGPTNQVWVLPGRGDGSFGAAIASPSLTRQGFLGYADLNHDGSLDLIIADRPASAMEVMFGLGDGTFQAGKEYLLSARPASIGIVPLLDGNTSVFTADNASNHPFLFFITSDGVVHSPELQTLGINPTAVVAADLNGDQRPDLVLTDASSGQVHVKLSNPTGGFADTVSYSSGSQPGALAVVDLNGDGLPDVVAADLGLDVLLGNGDGTLGAATTLASGGALTSIAVADFNLDGKPDVAAANAQAGGVSFYAGNGDGSFEAVRLLPLDGALSAVSADFNGDGKPDLAVTNGKLDFQTPGNLAILLGNGDGTFQQAANLALPGPLFSPALAVGDVNGDGIADVVTALFGPPSSIAVLLGNGDGTFGDPILIKSNTSPPTIAMADLNGDGKLDLVLADCCGLSEASYLLGNGDGTFQPEIQFPSGPNPQGIALSDLNGDGRPDFVIAGQVADATPRRGTLSIWYNSFTVPVAEAAALPRGEHR